MIIINHCSKWCTEWWGTGVVICLQRGADLHMAQLMPLPLTVSCSSEIQIGFNFLVLAHPGSPGKRAVKRVCVSGAHECYTNPIITRISIQTAGLAFGGTGLCSYSVRCVDGSCAKHLTVQSYTVVMLLTFILIIISIPSPVTEFRA